MSTAVESTPPSPIAGVPFHSNPFDPMPPSLCPCLDAQPQEIPDVDLATPFLFAPIPHLYTANYAAFSTAFLSPSEIADHWNDTPVVLNDFNSATTREGQFLDAVGRVSVYDHFKQRIIKATVIDFGSSLNDPRPYRFFATYSHLMDSEKAYIRLVAYNREGFRCDSSHPEFGNFILVVPQKLNDVAFPAQLRFHAKHVTEYCHNPDGAHQRIQRSAEQAFTQLEKVWWECGRCAVCDTDL